MKAVEFETLLKSDGSLEVPTELAGQIPKDRRIQVIVLFPESSDRDEAAEAAWQRVTQEQFLQGYAEGDSIYDSL